MRNFFVYITVFWLLTGCGGVTNPEAKQTAKNKNTVVSQTATPTKVANSTPTQPPSTAVTLPSPTPAPTIYVIQAGDTLLGIALQFDLSPNIIQEANGIVDPRFLQIGQEIIIPPPQADPNAPPTSTPIPPPLVIDSVNFQKTGRGTLWGLGEVSNPESKPIIGAAVEISLFDGSGALLARESAFTQLDVIQPGESAPFAILFDTPPGQFAQYKAKPVSGVPLSEQSRYYFELEPFDLRATQADAATYRISGQLRNTGEVDTESIRLVAVTYDKDNLILAQRQAELAVTLLKSGAVTPFEIDLIITHGVVKRYKILAQGLKAE